MSGPGEVRNNVPGSNTFELGQIESGQIESPKKGFTHVTNENEVTQSQSQSGGASSSGSPTESARETVAKKHQELDEMAEERASENPDYAALKAKLESCAGLEEMFLLIDKNVGWRDDKTVLMSDILALVNDTNQPNKLLRAAGVWLNDHRDILFALTKDDDRIGLHDVQNLIAGMKGELKGMKDAARAEIKEEMGISAPNANQTSSGQNAASSASQTPSPESLVPRPPPSTLPGMDGATENLAITGDYLQAQMMALAEEAAKDPSKATLNGQKIAMLQNKFQAITNMMNQLTQMISNMSKMWSDVAMNSIRNLR